MGERSGSLERGLASKALDDDGREARTGTLWTATAHIVTAVIGSGVLSLGWALAQIGWIAGPIALAAFSAITCYTSFLLAECYRSPDPIKGTRNHNYMGVVRALLGGAQVKLCGLAQYVNLVGCTIGYTITGSISMAAILRSNCFHKNGHGAGCFVSNYIYMAIFAVIEIIFSQLPNFHKLAGLSFIAAVMSFTYSGIGIGLAIARIVGGPPARTTLTGVTVGVDVTGTQKVWKTFQALGNIAFAYSYSNVLLEIQDTLKSSPPENKVMKKASAIGIFTTTIFYMLCGCLGYAAFGNDAPGNFLTGFGFYEPFWLIDIGNACIVLHLIGAYQVFCQPIYQVVEAKCSKWWPESAFLNKEYLVCGCVPVNAFRLVWRTAYVVVTSVIAMIFPFFNDFLGLLGACAFWPLSVHFPIEMHIVQSRTPRFSSKWMLLKALSYACLAISLAAAVGSVQGLVMSVQNYKPFQTPH